MGKLSKLIANYFVLFFLGPKRYAEYKGVRFGKNCDLLNSNWGSEPFLIELGDNVTVTSGVRFITHDGSTRLVKDNGRRYYKYGKIRIGNSCFIGINSIILPNIELGNNCIVGAGSVVTKSFKDGSIIAGNPARLITDFPAYEAKVKTNCSQDFSNEKSLKYEEKVNLLLSKCKSSIQ